MKRFISIVAALVMIMFALFPLSARAEETDAQVQKYTITIDPEMTGGIITANQSEAIEGDTIVLSVVPDIGYGIVQLSYVCLGISNNVEYDEIAGYCFIMPAGDVMVYAQFSKVDQEIDSISSPEPTPIITPDTTLSPEPTPSITPDVTLTPEPTIEPTPELTFEFYGLGTANDPFIITSAEDLKKLADLVEQGIEPYAVSSYQLQSDVDLGGSAPNIGTAEHPFSGSFDGLGNKITGLSGTGQDGYVGLFAVTYNAILANFALVDVRIDLSGDYKGVGSLVGLMQGGSLNNSYVTGKLSTTISGTTGALVGVISGGLIENCFSSVEIHASDYAGGIAGTAKDNATINCCYGNSFVITESNNNNGLIVGTGTDAVITNSYAVNGADSCAPSLNGEASLNAENYIGFDFSNVWQFGLTSGYEYPVLVDNILDTNGVYQIPSKEGVSFGSLPSDFTAPHYSNGRNRATYPSAYDLRNYGFLSTIRDQNPYGTCWAFSAMASAESNILKRYGKSANLSELQLAWFHYKGAKKADGTYNDPLNNFGGDHNDLPYSVLDFGGNTDEALTSLACWLGVVQEDNTTAYSMAAQVETQGLTYDYAFGKDSYHLQNVRMVNVEDIASIKDLIINYGAVITNYMHEDSFFNNGNGYYGVSYYDPYGDYTGMGHSVAIVGWNDNYSRYNFNSAYRPTSDGAWLIRNSWGTGAHSNGYFWMSYSSKHPSGYDNVYACDYSNSSKYNYCYQYDGATDSRCYFDFGTQANIANIFTAQHAEQIEAVSFWLYENANVTYSISIYKNPKVSTDPTSGTLISAATTVGTTGAAGYYTIPLKTAVSIATGDKFAVVLSLTSSSSDLHVYCDFTNASYGGWTYSYSEPGQSLFSDAYTGGYWEDLSDVDEDLGNWRIKVFTTKLSIDTPTLSSVTDSFSGVIFKWNAVANATTGYRVYRKTGSGSWVLLTTVQATTYTDTSAIAGTTYTYTVRATNGSVWSDFNPGLTITPVLAVAPKLVSLTNTISGIVFKWGSVSGASSYRVYRKTGTGSWTLLNTVAGTSYTDTKAVNGTTYTYTVRAVKGTSYSSYYSGLTMKCVRNLATPTLSSVTDTFSGVVFKWNAVADASSGYRVYRKTGSSSWVLLATVKTTSYTDYTAFAGSTYTYTVRATNGSVWSSYYSGLVIMPVLTVAPKLISVTNSSNGIVFQWGSVSGASSYRVYRKTGSGSWVLLNTVTANKYTDTTAINGTTYTYTVRAVKGSSYSCYYSGLTIKCVR